MRVESTHTHISSLPHSSHTSRTLLALTAQVADLVDPEMIPYKLLKENFKAWKEEAAAQEAAAAAGKVSATT